MNAIEEALTVSLEYVIETYSTNEVPEKILMTFSENKLATLINVDKSIYRLANDWFEINGNSKIESLVFIESKRLEGRIKEMTVYVKIVMDVFKKTFVFRRSERGVKFDKSTDLEVVKIDDIPTDILRFELAVHKLRK